MSAAKRCSKCKIEKPHSEFFKKATGRDSLTASCKDCHYLKRKRYFESEKGREVHRLSNAKYHRTERGQVMRRKHHLKRNYGITLEQFAALIEKQKGLCDCCGDVLGEPKQTHVDHDHETGEIRGVVCGPCNRTIGHSLESTERLDRAIRYLEKWRLAALARKFLVRDLGENGAGTNMRGSVGEHKSFISSETGSTPATATNLCEQNSPVS